MPIRDRTARASTRGSEISRPSNEMVPSSMSSSRFRQRSSVDLPEPDDPIRQMTSCLLHRQRHVVEDDPVAVRLAQTADLQERAHRAPARSRTSIRRPSQSVNRASGIVMTMKKHATTTYGV